MAADDINNNSIALDIEFEWWINNMYTNDENPSPGIQFVTKKYPFV